MRAILVSLIIFGSLPFIVMRPYIGLLVYSWISFASPHRLAFGFAYDFPFAMLVAVVFVGSWLLSKEPKALPITPVVVLMILFTFWMCFTTIFAFKGIYGQIGHTFWLERVLKIMVMTFLAMILLTNRQRIDGLIWIIVLSIGFYAIKGGIFTVVTGGQSRVYGPTGSMIEENNALGVATIMIVPLVRYLHLQATNKHIRRGLFAAIPILILSAIGSQSRGALVAICAMGGYWLMKSRHKASVGIVAVFVAVVGLSLMPQKWYDRMATIKNYEQDESAMGRINAWMTGLNIALDRPFVGGGFRALAYIPQVWEKYAPDPNLHAVAHSIYFQTLGEHGFPGLILFVTILFLTFRNGRWLIKQARARPQLHWAGDLGTMTQIALFGYAVGGAFLDLAYYDLYWNIVAILITARIIVGKEIAASDASPAAEGITPVAPTPAPALPRRSFLRGSGDTGGPQGFLRR